MCGIAGIRYTSEQSVSRDQLQKMTDAISHRGPDGEGFYISEDKKTGLGHRRLSILDPEIRSAQPFKYKNLVLTYNGEIYNYLEIKSELQQLGYAFQTTGDTEVLLMAYFEWGSDCLDRLDGMFAFAIFDENKDTLFCARDRMGEKPFYFTKSEDSFVFASEVKAIAPIVGKIEVNEKAVCRYLIYDLVANPHNAAESFFSNIQQLPPGSSLEIDANGFMKIYKYWSVEIAEPLKISEEEATERFRNLFSDSVKKRLRSDVPIGTSLSGGIDSSSVVASIFNIGIRELNTFTARFDDVNFDEGTYVDALNAAYAFKRNEVWPDPNALAENIDAIFHHQEEPFGSSSIFAQWEVMKLARERGVTVLLDGQGADELIGGYFKYLPVILRENIRQNPLKFYKNLKVLKRTLNYSPGKMDWLNIFLPEIFDIAGTLGITGIKKKKILSDLNPGFCDRNKESESPFETYKSMNHALHFDFFQYGLNKLLRFADRNSMAFSREVRLPFLSRELVEFAFSLPAELKINPPYTKYVLRLAMKNLLPSAICWRKDKKGFAPPQKTWMENPEIQKLLDKAYYDLKNRKILRNRNYIDPWQVIMIHQLYKFAEAQSNL